MRFYFKISVFLFFFLLSFNSDLLGQTATAESQITEADTLLKKAQTISDSGKYLESIPYVEQAQLLYQKEENWEKYVECLIIIARNLQGAQKIALQSLTIDQAIREARKYLRDDHPLLSKIFQQKGEIYIEAGQLDSAKLVLQKAISIGEKSKAWEDVAWALIIYSVANFYEEDFSSLEKNLDKAIVIVENEVADPYDHYGTIVQLQSILFDAIGNYQKAFAASKKTLKWFTKKPNASQFDSLAIANAFNTHGAICYERGDYDQAIQHYKVALDIHQKIKSDSKTLITLINNISIAYKRKTDWKTARLYLENSKALLPQKPDGSNFKEWINTYQLLASNDIDQKNWDSATALFEEILPYSEQFKFREYKIHNSIGNALLKSNFPEKARTHFNLALKKRAERQGLNNPYAARIFLYIGVSYADQNKPRIALDYFQKSLVALSSDFKDTTGFTNPPLENIGGMIDFLSILEAKGKALAQLSRADNKWETLALNTYRLAISAIDQMRTNYETAEAKLILSTKAKRIYEEGIHLLYLLYTKTNNEDYLAEAFQYAEKSKSLLLLEMIRFSEAQQNIVQPLYSNDTLFHSLLERGKQIKTDILFFEKKLSEVQQAKLPADHPKVKNAETALAQVYLEDIQWKTQIKESFPEYYNLQYDQSFSDLNDIKKNLIKNQSAFLEYFAGEEASFLFVITQSSTRFIQLPQNEKIETAIDHFLKKLKNPKALLVDAHQAFTDYNEVAFQLYKIILEPVISSLPPSVNELTIVPDGILNSIPFEALTFAISEKSSIDFEKLPYLLFRFEIHYGYSANLLLANQKRYNEISPNTECLALAPLYINKQELKEQQNILRDGSIPLEGTNQEIQSISDHFSGHFDYGSSATEALFKFKAPKFGILHLAMHGVANFENSNFGHLKFANSMPDSTEDNLLHHYEIANMTFNAQLAVLSACETGLGKYEEGEGVFSLARSFMYAGIPSITMSLWKIDDLATSQLMPYFYQNLAKGLEKDAALQMAKRNFLKEVDLAYKHPFYWSGLILLGDKQPLKEKGIKMWWWLVGGLVLFIIGFFLYRKQ